MKTFPAGADVTLILPFGDARKPEIPDVGSVTFTLYGQDGQPISGFVEVPITTSVTSFQATISIPAAQNSLAPGRLFERRKILITYKRAGQSFFTTSIYRIAPVANFSATVEEVRSFCGVNRDELEDSAVDLYEIYLILREQVGSAFDDALASGTLAEISANDAIRMRAVLQVLPSLKSRIAQSQTNGIHGFTRPVIKDFSEVERAAREKLADALSSIDETVGEVAYTYLMIISDVDPVTAGGTS